MLVANISGINAHSADAEKDVYNNLAEATEAIVKIVKQFKGTVVRCTGMPRPAHGQGQRKAAYQRAS